MQLNLSDEDKAAVGDARQFATAVIEPGAGEWERARAMPRRVMAEAGQAGLCNLLVPAELGGRELSFAALAQVMEELAAADLAAAFALVVHNNFARSLAAFGSDAMRERYLPGVMKGELIGSFLLTEPQSGSDAAHLTTVARQDGDHWRIDGEKAWVSNADKTDILALYLQTDASAGWRGIACVLVDRDTPGIELVGPYETLGAHAIGAGGFRFADCRVPLEQTMIPAGQGFKAAMGGIDLARALVASMCAGMLQSALDCVLPQAMERRAFGQAIAEFQGIQWLLADVATDLQAIRLLAREAVHCLDAGEDAAMAAAHAKKFATRAALKGLADCMQVMGADGFKQDYPLARHLACAKAAQYLDGTTEIQNVVISRGLLKQYGDGYTKSH